MWLSRASEHAPDAAAKQQARERFARWHALRESLDALAARGRSILPEQVQASVAERMLKAEQKVESLLPPP